MKARLSLPALFFSFALLAGNAHALDFGSAIGGGVGAVAGAVIGDSVGGRNGAIVGSGVGAVAGVVIGQSIDGPRYYPVHDGRYYGPRAPRVVEYRYYPEPYRYRDFRPRGHAWGHDRHHRRHGPHRHRHDW